LRTFADMGKWRLEGSRTATLIAEALLEEKGQSVVDNLIDRALAGSMAATRLALDRVSLSPRDRIAFDLPTLRSPSDVVAAVAAGEVAPRAAKEMMKGLRAHLAMLQAAAADAPDRAEPEARAGSVPKTGRGANAQLSRPDRVATARARG